MMPGTPNPSWGAEAFLDTPVINGTALSDADGRAEGLPVPDPERGPRPVLEPAARTRPTRRSDAPAARPAPTDTEVKMVPAATGAGLPDNWPQDGRAGGAPDPTMVGPNFVMIGTEGGFLPTAGGHPPPAGALEPRSADVQRRERLGLRAAAGTGGTRRRHRRLLGLRRQDADPLQRRAGRVPGAGSAQRLLHGQPGSVRHRRHRFDAAGLRPQHPHPHADQGGGTAAPAPFDVARADDRVDAGFAAGSAAAGVFEHGAGSDHRGAGAQPTVGSLGTTVCIRTTRASPRPRRTGASAPSSPTT